MAAIVVVNVDPRQVQVKPGEQAAATIVVRNRSEEVVHYLLQLEGVGPEWAEIVPNQVSAFPLQETRAQMTIHPPKETRGATYHLTVRALSQEEAGTEGTGLLDVIVPAPAEPIPAPVTTISPPPVAAARPQSAAQIEISAEPLKESKLPPPAAQWKLSLKNASNVLDTFGFNITGVRPNWVNVDPTALTLKPDEEGTAILTVRPGGETPGGVYPFKLRAFSHLNLNQRTELALQIQVRPSTGFKLSLTPHDAESQGSREFKVTLSSDVASNTDLWLQLAASDQDNACDYTFEPSQVFLQAKQTITTTLRVQPRAVLAANERKTYTFQVTATPRDGLAPAQSDEARLTQTGAAPLVLAIRPQVQSGELAADYAVTVFNPSTVETMVLLAGDDPAEACDYIFQPSRVALPPHGQLQVVLRVQAHASLESEGQAQIPFTVSAARIGELVAAAKADGKFVQLQLKSISLVLVPPQQSQPGRARYFVKTRNPRTDRIHISLDAKDEEDALEFSFQPAEIQLSAGADGVATLIARPKDKLPPAQQRRMHKFTVTGTVDGSQAVATAKGVLAQVRGTEYASFVGTVLRWGSWALKWVVALIVVFFATTFLTAGVQRIAERNPELGRLVYSIVSPVILRNLMGLSPFTGPAQGIVYLLEGILNTATKH